MHIVCIGIAFGFANLFWTTVLKRRLGDAAFDDSYGVWYFFVVATLLVAPVAVGFLYDAVGGYTLALAILVAAAFPTGIIGIFPAREERKPSQVTTS